MVHTRRYRRLDKEDQDLIPTASSAGEDNEKQTRSISNYRTLRHKFTEEEDARIVEGLLRFKYKDGNPNWMLIASHTNPELTAKQIMQVLYIYVTVCYLLTALQKSNSQQRLQPIYQGTTHRALSLH
jgi:hypothetical protein